MVRPRDGDSAVTYNQIVDAAQRVLCTDGPAKLSFRRVATEAEVAIGTVTYYFDDRAGLVEACMDGYYEELERLTKPLAAEFAQASEPARVIVRAAEQLTRFAFDHRGAVRLRLLSNAELGEVAPRRRTHFAAPILSVVIATASQMLGMDPDDARLTTYSINYAVMRYAAMSDAELCETTAAADTEAARELVVRHIRRMVERAMVPVVPCEGARG
jgi:AcrR family transcriptional regulator